MAMAMAMANTTATTRPGVNPLNLPVSSAAFAAKAATSAALALAAVAASQYADRRHAESMDAQAAYRRYPDDAEAASKAFSQRLTQDPGIRPSTADAVNVRAALRARPLSPRLFVLLATRADMAGDFGQEQKMMHLADQTTRRDPLNQLWLIEDAVKRGDIRGALHHYNAALTVGPELRPQLLPVLAAATAYPEVRAGLHRYIAKQVDWAPALIEQTAQTASPADLANLVLPVSASLTAPSFDHARAAVIVSLAMGGRADLAFTLAARTIPNLNQAAMHRFAFTSASTDARIGTLAWSMPQSDTIRSVLDETGTLTAEVGQLARGVLATRDVPVTPGATYQLEQSLAYDGSSPKARLTWSGSCVSRERVQSIWEQAMPEPLQLTTYRAVIRIPTGCYLLRMTASVEGADTQSASVVKIPKLKFERI